MDPPPSSPAPANPSGYYVWEPAGKLYAVHLHSELIDRLNYEVMRGFGALPKRGAEVGGVLLGSVEQGARRIVRVQDFQSIPCEHLLGPSYVLSDKDRLELDRVLERSAKAGAGEARVVGLYRSITRDVIQLTEQDLALLDARFPDEGAACLLIKPYNTRPNEAVLLCRENGAFPTEPQTRTFVFRRKEMGVGPAPPRVRSEAAAPPPGDATAKTDAAPSKAAEEAEPPRRVEAEIPSAIEKDLGALMSRGRRRQRSPLTLAASGEGGEGMRTESQSAPEALEENGGAGVHRETADSQGARPGVVRAPVQRNRWVWVPLSFIFLILGVVLGFEIGLGFYRAQNLALTGDPYELELSVSRFGDSYHLKWNPEAVAVRAAQRGELVVEDGSTSTPMALPPASLARGGLIYRGSEHAVRFRLTLFLSGRSSFSEMVETQPAAR
jgi:hypothetical protein